MNKFIQIYFFHHFTFSLPTKQKEGKLKSFLSSHHFLSSHFSTPPTKHILKSQIFKQNSTKIVKTKESTIQHIVQYETKIQTMWNCTP